MVVVDRPSDYFRPEAHEAFWYWINERHRIFLKRWRGDPKPWTDDPVLQNWKFCNPFRVNDKQTKLLMDNVILPHWNSDPALMLFNIYAFRAFNWWPTYANLVKDFGKNGWLTQWSEVMAWDSLEDTIKTNGQLTSGAYMIRGREAMPKYKSIAQTLDHVWRLSKPLAHVIGNMNRMGDVANVLMENQFWGWGHFTTYQVVLDLTYSPLLQDPIDINTWCEFGPGARRGIRCIWPQLPNRELVTFAMSLQLHQKEYLEEHVPYMTLQDIEFSLCELSKYLRIKNGGKGKEGYAGR